MTVTTSSHKDMLAVRLGMYNTNDEALEEYSEGSDLIGTNMMGSEIDKILIERESDRIKKYYESIDHPDAELKANEFYKSAMTNVFNQK